MPSRGAVLSAHAGIIIFVSAQGIAVSLFSGAGGLDLGAERAGYEVRAAVEWDDDAAATMEKNLSRLAAPVIRSDILQTTTRQILQAAGLRQGERPDLLIGGPPCTPFSKSGFWLEWKRDGLDPDASLLQEYTRVLAEAKPHRFVLENVYALTYNNKASKPAFERLLREIDSAGYLGQPHVTVGEVFADLITDPEPGEAVNGKYGHLLPAIPPGDNYLFYTAKRGHPEPLFGWRSKYWSFLLKLAPNRPAPTIQAQPGPYIGPFHWENRRLRVAEIKRLFTYPDNFELVGSRSSIQAQLGNSVPPLLAEKVVQALTQ
jgi:DNA (cytosine-5)-methyltransferase 1